MRPSPVIGLFILMLGLPISSMAQIATPSDSMSIATSGDFAGLVDIGGRQMYLTCRGVGSPTVILEAGAGNDADTWDTVGLTPDSTQTAVLPGVASFTQVCAYDRPGTLLDLDHRSRSDPVPMPRTAADVVADLHALLSAAAIPGPYVMAAHSFGGLVVRLYTATYPDEVVGLVLIDAAHEDYYTAMRETLTPEQRAQQTRLEEQGPPELADYPNRERLDPDASAAEVRAATSASPLRPLPLIVLTHGRSWDWPPSYPAAALEAVWLLLQENLAALTPNSRLVVAGQSGHFIPGDQPDLVIDAIRQVVDAVRDPSMWATPQATLPI